MKLYTAWRSSAAYRMRIALNLKGLAVEMIPVHLAKGQQFKPDYVKVNPQAIIPALVEDDGRVLTQSLAIMEYLDEAYPATHRLVPGNATERAWIRAFALAIACEIHPLNNLRVLNHLTGAMGLSEEAKLKWYHHWIAQGLAPLETLAQASPKPGRFVFGDAPSMADVCLVPQIANARRFNCDLGGYPTLVRIDAECRKLDAFDRAQPSKQPDAE
jgi:maleylacetoacetate isomerase